MACLPEDRYDLQLTLLAGSRLKYVLGHPMDPEEGAKTGWSVSRRSEKAGFQTLLPQIAVETQAMKSPNSLMDGSRLRPMRVRSVNREMAWALTLQWDR